MVATTAAILDFGSKILTIFYQKQPRNFLPSFGSVGFFFFFFFVQDEKRKTNTDIQDLGFPTRTILAIFNLQFIPVLPIELQVSWPFGSGEEAKK